MDSKEQEMWLMQRQIMRNQLKKDKEIIIDKKTVKELWEIAKDLDWEQERMSESGNETLDKLWKIVSPYLYKYGIILKEKGNDYQKN